MGIFIKLCHLNENYYFLSICLYFDIIGIRKYAIQKIIYNISNNSMGLLSAMTIITKTKVPEARD